MGFPEKQGLYDPANEHDSCGVGFVANIKGRKSHEVIECGLQILVNLDHRGAVVLDGCGDSRDFGSVWIEIRRRVFARGEVLAAGT